MRLTLALLAVFAFILNKAYGEESPVFSGNPILEGWYADPEGAVIDGKYWIFPTTSAAYAKQLHFDAFSSPDLVTWKKHPRVLDASIIAWAKHAMWAPSIIEKDGKCFLFFSANDIQRPGSVLWNKNNSISHAGGIGVAVADNPAGPYRDYLGKPLISDFYNNAQPIDQFVFKDVDGTHYMYYGGWRHCNVGILKDDFTGFVPNKQGKLFEEITPDGYVEGPVLFLRNGKYYFLWSEGSWGNSSYRVAYAVADHPKGPFERKGVILESDSAIATGAGHNSVINIPGTDQWYVVYHRRPIPNKGRDHRVTCIDRLDFHTDGTIKKVKITNKGVAQRPLKRKKISRQQPNTLSAATVAAWGAETLQQIRDDFWLDDLGLYAEATTTDSPSIPQPAFMWSAGVQLTALVSAAEFSPTKYTNQLNQYANILQSYWNQHDGIRGYDVQPNPQQSERYYDDNAWIVLALVDAFEITGDQKYLNRAVETFRFVLSGEDKKLGGGIYWREDRKQSKNTCSNAPAVVAALRLYNSTHDAEYLQTAKRLYEWTCVKLQNPSSGLFWDNIRLNGRVDRRKYSYNTALMIRANCLLYEATGDVKYLNEAKRVARAALKRWVIPETGGIRDTGKFAHMLLESFVELHRYDPKNDWLSVVQKSVAYVHNHLQQPNGQYPSRWDTTSLPLPAQSKLIDQASAARAFFYLANALNESKLSQSSPWTRDEMQKRERTCFQTARSWDGRWNLRSDVAIAYGIDPKLPERIESWRDHGYRIHAMTGVSWGNYQDFLYGRFDGEKHLDEAQTVRDGRKSSHGGDAYYMCPSTAFGEYLCTGVQRALDAGVEAVHLEEPEFWVNSGYSEGFKREWQSFYEEPWQAPHESVDSQWRASKLKYFLYRRTLQQVFDYVQAYNTRTGRNVRCYVPTHSLINYASWEIVSPEASLANLTGCDGYIAQVWTGTARTPNMYRGKLKQRTFETAFLEYGVMQNLVRGTGRTVWFLNDPIEDNPNHDWNDYQQNWESTLVASLLQPEVSRYEVAPWPERIFTGRYPRSAPRAERKAIPSAYAAELQTVMNALNDMKQERIEWDCGTTGIGVLVSDSLMFQRGEPVPGDPHLSNFYGLTLPLLKRGIPVAPLQLENLSASGYLSETRILLLSYQGMKPLTPEVHKVLANWVKQGGVLLVVDDDSDPYNRVREWWNSGDYAYATPRQHLFELLGHRVADQWDHGHGRVIWMREDPVDIAESRAGDERLANAVRQAAKRAGSDWRETNYLQLRRGPYLIAAGLDESVPADTKRVEGTFVDLFDSALALQTAVDLKPGKRALLYDLNAVEGEDNKIIASSCKALLNGIQDSNSLKYVVEGIANTPAVVLIKTPQEPKAITLDGSPVMSIDYLPSENLLWIRFANEARPRELRLDY